MLDSELRSPQGCQKLHTLHLNQLILGVLTIFQAVLAEKWLQHQQIHLNPWILFKLKHTLKSN